MGRVIIFRNPPSWKFEEMKVLYPKDKKANSLFGFAVANIGDIDKDSLEDFAVGAPKGGEDGIGEVYIFHGDKSFDFSK